ncbi:MAG: hypothetical protein A2014_00950 [Spirochaetes bacterium GWF1_49_6]|nr:MAG: hypothetical protein A2014_00950 [Spirochaetes bacterium GWF1_49_6]
MNIFKATELEEKRNFPRFQVYQYLRMNLDNRTIVCLIKNLSGNGGFLEVDKKYRGEIHQEDKGKIADFHYLSEEITPSNGFKGQIIRYYKEKDKKYIGVFFLDEMAC